ncbi:MAG: drug/metabolite transporter (DMT)-like permease [Oleiphilaceae bacterium]|jgi:drug/metabolite transporter (DMT)-like permease
MKTKGYLCALAAVLIWTGFILVSRMGGISPLTAYDIIAIRYVSCASLVFPFWFYWRRFDLLQPKLIICSFIGGLGYALCAFNGFKVTPASHAAVLLPGLLPILIALISTFINKERHSAVKWLGIIMITSGIVVLFGYEFQKTGSLSVGHTLLVGAAVCWAIFSVLINRWKILPWEATVSLALITCVVYMPVYFMYLPKNISTDLLHDIGVQVVYQGFLATIVQMLFYVRAVQLIGVANMGSMMAIVPILAGCSAIYIFDENLSTELIFAMLFVSLGVWIANSKWNTGIFRINNLKHEA